MLGDGVDEYSNEIWVNLRPGLHKFLEEGLINVVF